MRPHEEDLMQPTAFGRHFHTCLILKKMTQLVRFKATQD